MNHLSTVRDVPHSNAEICLNLWFFVSTTGIITRLAGKAYALTGTGDQQYAILNYLARTDHLTATVGKVPDMFTLDIGDEKMHGAILMPTISDDHEGVYGPLMEQIERELPKGFRFINGTYESFEIKLPQDLLCCTTAVYEQADGELVASVGVYEFSLTNIQ